MVCTHVPYRVKGKQPGVKNGVVDAKGAGQLATDIVRAATVEGKDGTEGHDFNRHPDRQTGVVVAVLLIEVLHKGVFAALGFAFEGGKKVDPFWPVAAG